MNHLLVKFEHKSTPLLPRKKFYGRVLRYAGFSLLLLGFSLGIGVIGYHYFSDLNWLDALLNAVMILTGMGPIAEMKSDGAKWFASLYAIFSGVAFLSTVAVFLSPVVHRFMHKLHIDGGKDRDR
jgi:hypothetical protein